MKKSHLPKMGCRIWKDAHEKFSERERSQAHVDATLDFAFYCTGTSIVWRGGKIRRKVEQNRSTIKCLIDITIFLAKQALAFRGHNDDMSIGVGNKGNFIATVEFLSKYNKVMASHLSNVKQKRIK